MDNGETPLPPAGEAAEDLGVWRRTLAVAWLGQVAAIMGFSFTGPFMPFFLKDLGLHDEAQRRIWSGYISSATAVTMMLTAPLWGVLADRFGKKLMVLRAMFAGALIVSLMGLATSPMMLFWMRLIQGCFTGTVGASAALVASVTPPRRAGFSLGLMATAVQVGNSVGPLVGGMAAREYGYRVTFAIGGLLLLVGGVLMLLFAREGRAASAAHAPGGGEDPADSHGVSGLLRVLGTPGFKTVVFLSLVMAFARTVMNPVFSLYVEHFTGRELAPLVTGKLLFCLSATTALTALPMGMAADRFGYKAFLVGGVALSGLMMIPQAFAGSAGELYGYQVLIGLSLGMTGPAMGRFLHRTVPGSSHGKAFGLNQSGNSLGFAMGPLTGGYLSAWLGLRAPFVVTGALQLLVCAVAWVVLSRVEARTQGRPVTAEDGHDESAGPTIPPA